MSATPSEVELARRLQEAQSTIAALVSGQVDAVVDAETQTPVLLATAQAALRQSEERHRRIVETTSEGICTVDAAGIITFVNRRFADMLEYPAQEVVGRSMLDFVPDDTRARAASRLGRSRRGEPQEDEVRMVRRSGAEVWLLLKTSPIRDGDGHHVGTLAMMTDRTRHREAEQALRRSEAQYRQIVEATTDGILQVDAESIIVFVNHRLADMLGYSPDEMVGKSLSVFDMPVVAVRAGRSRAQGSPALDHTFRHRNGTDIAVNVGCSPLFDAEGRAVGELRVVRDMTERDRLQAQLVSRDRMASMGTLAAGVAHEINNPLSAVMANLEFVSGVLHAPPDAHPPLREDVAAAIREAQEATERVRLIVRDMGMFSRSPTDERHAAVDVESVMESSLRMAWNEIRHRATVVRSYGRVPKIEGDAARIGQVLLNLVINAAQAIPEGAAEHNQIRVSTRLEDQRVVIEVADTGPGIAPEVLGRIFDAFFTTKEVGSGMGLGLAICQRIVADMDGELAVESAVGKGSMFRVSLPVTRRGASLAAAPAVMGSSRARILIIDDDELVLTSLERIFGVDYDVTSTSAAADALRRCRAGERFELILCDLMMPDMTGIDLHRELLGVAPDQAARMVFATGGAYTTSARQFLAETHNPYIEKPFDPAALRTLVREHVASTPRKIGAPS